MISTKLTHKEHPCLYIGLDVGSTTVKATVVNSQTKAILWHDYQRHHTKQAEVVLDFLTRIEANFTDVIQQQNTVRIFVTGSGAGPLAPLLGAKFIQEVNAVTRAVETLHPDVGSVIELGGQDAKIIIFKDNPETGNRQAITSMNDKCASGTGATIDKCMIKAGITQAQAAALTFSGEHLHHVAAKCGVFAETDIVNLVKTGVPAEEIMCSLADAIVMQNLSVLTRGNTLRHNVLLLGGPNTYLPFLQACWRLRIPETWRDRYYDYPNEPLENLIYAPENAELFAAYGAVLFGLHEPEGVAIYRGLQPLREFIAQGRQSQLSEQAGPPLIKSLDELEHFKRLYSLKPFKPAPFKPGERVDGFLGLDGGSTSSKCVVLDAQGKLRLKVYQLSKGNPLQDMKEMLTTLHDSVMQQGASLNIKGFGVTGYAADVLQAALSVDVNIVETVAHMNAAMHYFPEVDVICDIGGQDIKVLMVQNKSLKNFRLSNQCSAGNGMLLQAMADQFNVPVEDYAEHAFAAELSPEFSYGCAVFLDADRVNFQREGFQKGELMAGLARVLPMNVWQYVVQIPRMAELGRHFVLQGGTQHNLAALKSQVDYIKARVPDAEVAVHPYPGEAGAIGAALEAIRVVKRRGYSTYVGLNASKALTYNSQNDASTVCTFCPNHCSRTFIDTETPTGDTARYISGFSCEKGTVEDKAALLRLERERQVRMTDYPNLVYEEAVLCYKHNYEASPLPDLTTMIIHTSSYRGISKRFRQLLAMKTAYRSSRRFQRSNDTDADYRKGLRIAMPKVLNMWSTGPFWRTYFETLGIPKGQILFSDDTTEALFNAGAKYGAIDPCFPAKVVQSHIHNLLFDKHKPKRPIHYLFFPVITHIPSFLENVMDTACCPIVSGTPNVIKAAFTREVDFFSERGIEYVDSAMTMNEPALLKQQLYQCWGEKLRITEDENHFAVDEAWKSLEQFNQTLENQGRIVIDHLEKNGKVGILMLGRPYHNDPGLNHEITEEFQALGYPILSIRSIPKDTAWLSRYFNDHDSQGMPLSPLDIRDVWPENYSVNSAQKVWAAKFAARHPNIAVLDLSSFKCGHDAPTYGLIDSIVSTAAVPYSALHDIDANKPTGSMKIRVKTFAHTLALREELLQDASRRNSSVKDFAPLVFPGSPDSNEGDTIQSNASKHQSLIPVTDITPTCPTVINE